PGNPWMQGSALLSFFLFQAEDGIRDFHVTGVQTCALPIWGRGRLPAIRRLGGINEGPHPRLEPTISRRSGRLPARRFRLPGESRSEERRVGKEWRSRGEAGAVRTELTGALRFLGRRDADRS